MYNIRMGKLKKLKYFDESSPASREVFFHSMKKRTIDNNTNFLNKLSISLLVKNNFFGMKYLLGVFCFRDIGQEIQDNNHNKNVARDDLLNLRNGNIKLAIIQNNCGFWIITDYIDSFYDCYKILSITPGIHTSTKNYFWKEKSIKAKASPFFSHTERPPLPRFLTVYDGHRVYDAETYIKNIGTAGWETAGLGSVPIYTKEKISLFDQWLKLYYEHWQSPEINWCIEHRNFGSLVDWEYDDVWLEEMNAVNTTVRPFLEEKIEEAINPKIKSPKKPKPKKEDVVEQTETEDNPFIMMDLD